MPTYILAPALAAEILGADSLDTLPTYAFLDAQGRHVTGLRVRRPHDVARIRDWIHAHDATAEAVPDAPDGTWYLRRGDAADESAPAFHLPAELANEILGRETAQRTADQEAVHTPSGPCQFVTIAPGTPEMDRLAAWRARCAHTTGRCRDFDGGLVLQEVPEWPYDLRAEGTHHHPAQTSPMPEARDPDDTADVQPAETYGTIYLLPEPLALAVLGPAAAHACPARTVPREPNGPNTLRARIVRPDTPAWRRFREIHERYGFRLRAGRAFDLVDNEVLVDPYSAFPEGGTPAGTEAPDNQTYLLTETLTRHLLGRDTTQAPETRYMRVDPDAPTVSRVRVIRPDSPLHPRVAHAHAQGRLRLAEEPVLLDNAAPGSVLVVGHTDDADRNARRAPEAYLIDPEMAGDLFPEGETDALTRESWPDLLGNLVMYVRVDGRQPTLREHLRAWIHDQGLEALPATPNEPGLLRVLGPEESAARDERDPASNQVYLLEHDLALDILGRRLFDATDCQAVMLDAERVIRCRVIDSRIGRARIEAEIAAGNLIPVQGPQCGPLEWIAVAPASAPPASAPDTSTAGDAPEPAPDPAPEPVAPDPGTVLDTLEASFEQTFSRTIQEVSRRKERHAQRARQARQELIQAMREHDALQRQLEQLRARIETPVADARADLERMLEDGTLTGVRGGTAGTGSELVLTTPALVCTRSGDGARFDVGRFDIRIDFASGAVRFASLDRKHPHWIHPHVDQTGTACFGNAEEAIQEMIARVEIAALTGLLIDFLSNANANDGWGRTVAQWPPADVPEPDGPDLSDPEERHPLEQA